MDELSADTKSVLVKLIGFCETLSDALHPRRNVNRTAGGSSFATEEAKVDTSFVSALYSAYSDLLRRPDNNANSTVAKIFGVVGFLTPVASKNVLLESSVRGRRPKSNSTLSDVLKAPSIVQKAFLTSFPEKAAASRQVRRVAGALLLSNRMEGIYG